MFQLFQHDFDEFNNLVKKKKELQLSFKCIFPNALLFATEQSLQNSFV